MELDPRILSYYQAELQYMREMGSEFAATHPKIARRLALDGIECADPYVERLMEGLSFLAARVQYKIDAEYPRFTQHLLERIEPHYLAPTPSMATVRFQPSLGEGALIEGIEIPRHSVLRSGIRKSEQTACEYRTAHDVTLWPLELSEAHYYSNNREVASLGVKSEVPARAALRLKLHITAPGVAFSNLQLRNLVVHLTGAEGDPTPMGIYEQLFADTLSVWTRGQGARAWSEVRAKPPIGRIGFNDDEALLHYDDRSFQGYRLVHEYFAFPRRFLYADFRGLDRAVRETSGTELELLVLFRRGSQDLTNSISIDNFSLFCSPAINLFPKRTDRIRLDDRSSEYQVIPDRTRPMDYEVHRITSVLGHGTQSSERQEFAPLYGMRGTRNTSHDLGYYTARRVPREKSRKQRGSKNRLPQRRTEYIGSEVFVSIVDVHEAPYSTDLRQLSVEVLCSNRDLALLMPLGNSDTDFTIDSGAPVDSIRCVSGPTHPRQSLAEGKFAWQVISHLSLNYLSLVDGEDGATALRELLSLYAPESLETENQINGLVSVSAEPVTKRITAPGPISFGRGLEVTLTFDESEFEGSGMFLLGAVLEQLLAKWVSINSFTQTVVRSTSRGEVIRWPVRDGRRPVL